MPEITIEQSTFERLQHHAKPLVDTPDTIINRAIDTLEQYEEHVTPGERPGASEREIDPRRLPSLKHTKVIDASIGGKFINNPKWNVLVEQMLIQAMKHLSDFHKLNKLCSVNMVQGYKDDEGYRYISEIDISFQGLSAEATGNALLMLAQSLGIALDIGFMWRRKEEAAYPGEKARLKAPGSKIEISDNTNRIPSPFHGR